MNAAGVKLDEDLVAVDALARLVGDGHQAPLGSSSDGNTADLFATL